MPIIHNMNQVYRIATRKTGLSVNELKNVHDAIFNATIKVLQDKKSLTKKTVMVSLLEK